MGGPLPPRADNKLPQTGLERDSDEKSFGRDDEKGAFETTADGEEPNEEERRTLRHVSDNLNMSIFLIAFVELCERFTYYGVSGLFQNYIQRPYDGSEGRGALGLGHQSATALSTFFQFFCYVTPIFGAIVADQYLGKYLAILIFCGVYICGLLILTLTSIPAALENGAGLGGFATAVVIIGIGTGGIKSNVAPLIADQYKRRTMAVSTTKKGERVILDPNVTIQRIYMVFYLCINIGCLALLATPYMELYIGFWSAYLLGTCMFVIGVVVLLAGKKLYIVNPPQGSIITDAFKVIWIMMKNRNMDAPKPSVSGRSDLHWDDKFVDEVKRALVACQVFTFYPIYWVVYGQFSNNFISQAGQMAGHGIPNDLMQNFDPIAIIVFVPILDRLVYPLLRKLHINFPPINRITVGFWVASLAMVYAAILQHYIYSAGPCYEQPLCEASEVDGVAYGNNIHIAIQAPAYMLIGISEIFASVTGLEYAYTKAPPSMKSFVQSMYLLTNAFGSAIGLALVSVATDPKVLWMYAGLAVSSFIAGCLVWIIFHKYNRTEEEMNALS
ncbi:PTR2-domain-containing protein [Aulographum hederae CBS 113979]|uniref:PTR2-domain-containing protein n=1 Tax=Aulographum hederae CBS 113979 TaxID=1176131 RepID=A0A6G1GWR0_9PEZI|nr:PTR2-domain-containing protein [Aulographum hederae CBS 113979]